MSDKASIDDVLKEAAKKYDLRVAPLNSIVEDVQAYSTGNIAIDHITGVNGLPVGRSVELYGAASSGKTTTALQCAVQLQKLIMRGGNDDVTRGPLVAPTDRIVYFDYEHAIDPVYCKALGLDVDHPSFLFAQPESLEQGSNVARKLVETGELRLMIWDSVAAAVPSAKASAEIGKSLPAIAAKLYADFTSSLNEPLHRNNCTALWINHIMELMDMGSRRPGMPPLTSTPGGRALKFYSSLRIEYRQAGNIKEKVVDSLTQEISEITRATNVRVKVTKNKVGSPFREAIVRVRYGKGFDDFWSALQILIAHKHVKYSAGFFYFHDVPDLVHVDMERAATGMKRPYVRGEANIFAFADARLDWREQVIGFARTVVSTGVAEVGLDVDLDELDLSEEETAMGRELVDSKTGEIVSEVLPDEELISESELEAVSSFIGLGIGSDIEQITDGPIKVAKAPAKKESKDADFTASLLEQI